MNNAVRMRWLMVCTPFLGRLKQDREKLEKQGRGFFRVIGEILRSLSPVTSNVASAMISVDPLEYIPLEPEAEDYHDNGKKKRVVLVFDDLDRANLGWQMIVGNINEYCENKGFKTIVIADEEAIYASPNINTAVYRALKEKTIAYTVTYNPDHRTIIHDIIDRGEWHSAEYADFLTENEQTIRDAFVTDPEKQSGEFRKFHNIRSLIFALQEFSRVYEILVKTRIPDLSRYLSSFIAYILVSKNGVRKNGQLCYEVGDDDIRLLYPGYSAETLPESVRQWIDCGIWEEDAVAEYFSRQACGEGREEE